MSERDYVREAGVNRFGDEDFGRDNPLEKQRQEDFDKAYPDFELFQKTRNLVIQQKDAELTELFNNFIRAGLRHADTVNTHVEATRIYRAFEERQNVGDADETRRQAHNAFADALYPFLRKGNALGLDLNGFRDIVDPGNVHARVRKWFANVLVIEKDPENLEVMNGGMGNGARSPRKKRS